MSLEKEKHHKLAADGFDQFKKLVGPNGKPSQDDHDFNKVLGEIIKLQRECQNFMNPIIQAGGLRDMASTEVTIVRFYLNHLCKWSKDHLLQTVAWQLTGAAMQGLYPEQFLTTPKIPSPDDKPTGPKIQ